MLPLNSDLLMRMIRGGFEFMNQFVTKRAEMVQRFAGPHYRQDNPAAKSPENYPFAYKQFVSPQLLFDVPQCWCRPDNSVADAAVADAIELALNRWAKETSVQLCFEEALDDAFFGFGITCVGLESRGHYQGAGLSAVQGDFEQIANYPFVVQIGARDFFIDPRMTKVRKARYMGHRFERDLEDVRNDDRYEPEARERLVETPSSDGDDPGDAFNNRKYDQTSPDLAKLTMYQMYLPEHGLILTLAETGRTGTGEDGSGECIVLRQEKYWGPDEGPYDIWGLDSVPGEAMPISALVALWDEFMELNAHSIQAARDAAAHKRVGVFAPGAKEDAERIANADSGQFVPVQDPNAVKEIFIGGTSAVQQQWIQFLRERFDRNLGFTDAQRGQVKASVTATQADIANSNSDLRIQNMQKRIRRAVTSIFRKVAWYFFHDESIEPMELEKIDPVTGAKIAGTFYPGPWYGGYVQGMWIPPMDAGDWTDYNLDINPKSMGRQDDALQQKRAQDELGLVSNLASMFGPQAINWRRVLNRYGQTFGERDYADIVLSPQFAMMLGPDMGQANPMQAQMMRQQSVNQAGPVRQQASMRGGLMGQARAAG